MTRPPSCPATHRIPVRIYYEDTDLAGVVYYANYLRYMERGRTELLRAAGIHLDAYHRDGIVFAVIETTVRYRSAAQYGDVLDVETALCETTRSILVFDTRMYNQHGTLVCTSRTRLVCVGPSGRVSRIPPELLDMLQKVTGTTEPART